MAKVAVYLGVEAVPQPQAATGSTPIRDGVDIDAASTIFLNSDNVLRFPNPSARLRGSQGLLSAEEQRNITGLHDGATSTDKFNVDRDFSVACVTCGAEYILYYAAEES